MRVHDKVHGWEVREGEVADMWGPRASESELANGQSALTGQTCNTSGVTGTKNLSITSCALTFHVVCHAYNAFTR